MRKSPISYAIWNNKGGVGKTFLSYVFATEYAAKHPDEYICVVDMCPQSNISQVLLGGNGKGTENHDLFIKNQKTIADYLKERYYTPANARTGTETSYFFQANKYNYKMPENLYLLAGSNDLDGCSNLINYMGNGPVIDAWKSSRFLLKTILDVFAESYKGNVVFFIDCNPSFAPYTELAMLASDYLIVPCTADIASYQGLKSVFRLVHGVDVDIKDNFLLGFYKQASQLQLKLPQIKSTILNLSRTYLKNSSSAFKAHAKEIEGLTMQLKSKHRDLFGLDENIFFNIKDGNMLAKVLAYEGDMLSKIKAGVREVYDDKTQVNEEQIIAMQNDVNRVVDTL